MKFRKKPAVVEAVQWIDDRIEHPGINLDERGYYVITIHEQAAYLEIGDWILPEPKEGRFYPCKPDIFEKTYEKVEE